MEFKIIIQVGLQIKRILILYKIFSSLNKPENLPALGSLWNLSGPIPPRESRPKLKQ